jgi:CSLREA domain-containing protein
LALIGLLMAGLGRGVSAAPTTYTVTKTADTADGTCSVADCSLREAVIAANANSGTDTINLPGGTIIFQIAGAGENAAATGDLDLTDDVTINGNNTIVNGGDLDRVFHILPGAEVTISDITIFDGINTSGYPGGGGIGLEGSLTISHSVISSNQETGSGGGIGMGTDAHLNMDDVVVSDNTAIDGGGLFHGSGSLAEAAISNSTFIDNVSENDGGGLAFLGAGILTLTDTDFVMNTANGGTGGTANGGGAIKVGGATDSTIDGGSINGNKAPNGVGAGLFADAAVTVFNTAIVNNDVGGIGGGGVFVSGDTNLNGVLVDGNSAPNGNGGGIAHTASDLTIDDSTIRDNDTGGNGGASTRSLSRSPPVLQ